MVLHLLADVNCFWFIVVLNKEGGATVTNDFLGREIFMYTEEFLVVLNRSYLQQAYGSIDK